MSTPPYNNDKKEYDEIRKRITNEDKNKKEQHFLITVCETYDGLEFYSSHIVKAKSKESLEYMSEKDLVYYGHEDTESETIVTDVQPIKTNELKILQKFLN